MSSVNKFLILFLACLLVVNGADPDPVRDFCIPTSKDSLSTCKDPKSVTGRDFSSQVLRIPGDLASVSSFPALNTLGIAVITAALEPRTGIPLHIHPRSSELLYIEEGTVQIGFIDTSNVLYMNTVEKRDIFIIPRGLIHYLYNVGNSSARVVAVFNSQEPGTQLLGPSVFGSGVPDDALMLSLSLNQTTIDALRSIYAPS